MIRGRPPRPRARLERRQLLPECDCRTVPERLEQGSGRSFDARNHHVEGDSRGGPISIRSGRPPRRSVTTSRSVVPIAFTGRKRVSHSRVTHCPSNSYSDHSKSEREAHHSRVSEMQRGRLSKARRCALWPVQHVHCLPKCVCRFADAISVGVNGHTPIGLASGQTFLCLVDLSADTMAHLRSWCTQ
jgi:hypothetical protein